MFKKLHKPSKLDLPAMPFALSGIREANLISPKIDPRFNKIVAGGCVVRLCDTKSIADRMIGDGVSKMLGSSKTSLETTNKVILEMVVANLSAGVSLLDKQELMLAKIGGRLSEMALCLNHSRANPKNHLDAQTRFEVSRANYRSFIKETFDHTALFSMGPANPVVVAIPNSSYWELLFIDRCNVDRPGLRSIEAGKVSPLGDGLLLDPQSFARAFGEWRLLCANNRMQWHLLHSHWQSMCMKLSTKTSVKAFSLPELPKCMPALLSNYSYFKN